MTVDIMDFDRATEPYTYVAISSLVIVGKQIERLQEQLKEANEALKKVQDIALSVDLSGLDYDNRHKMYDIMFSEGVIDSYLERWGVK